MAPEVGREEGPKCQAPEMMRSDVCVLFLTSPVGSGYLPGLSTVPGCRQGQGEMGARAGTEAEGAGRRSSRQGRGRQGLVGAGKGMHRQQEGRG